MKRNVFGGAPAWQGKGGRLRQQSLAGGTLPLVVKDNFT